MDTGDTRDKFHGYTIHCAWLVAFFIKTKRQTMLFYLLVVCPVIQSKITQMKKATIVEITSSLLILLFVYTALSKLAGFVQFKETLRKSPFIGSNASWIAWMLPVTELIVALLLLMPFTRLLGLYSSLALMIIFTVYIAYMLAFTPKLPCSCGGVLKDMTWKQHLVFNIFFTLLASIGVRLFKKRFPPKKSDQSPSAAIAA
jgi:putative oxidoreductase